MLQQVLYELLAEGTRATRNQNNLVLKSHRAAHALRLEYLAQSKPGTSRVCPNI